ncbi:MAG: DNA mismatch repair endonuclease MutL [Candidatus Hydrogenedentes bacterium]|nr:DNA mismatch repair endonuclease MutL [Candidatus Hydrogenedentota bacterium]
MGGGIAKSVKIAIPAVRILPEDVANKIAAGEVVERPASVVKELVENALDARATRIVVRIVAAGRRTIEVIDNGHGMSEQDALLAIERHATSKIRKADDLDNIVTLGFRGEALASIAAVSRFELVTRRAKDESATRIRIDGGILRDVSQVAAPPGTRVTVNRLYFNTPVRSKFLKGITTELSHSIDCVQRHALAQAKVGFAFSHNDKSLLDIPENATLRERVALIWGLNFLNDLIEVEGEKGGLLLRGLIGAPRLSRSQRSHQFFFMNRRPVVNRSLQYGFEDGYRELLTIGRHPVGIVLLQTHPRFVDVNIHPAKREIRFRDERAARDAVRDIIRECLTSVPGLGRAATTQPDAPRASSTEGRLFESPAPAPAEPVEPEGRRGDAPTVRVRVEAPPPQPEQTTAPSRPEQTEFHRPAPSADDAGGDTGQVAPEAFYESLITIGDAPLQIFDTYLLVPEEERLLIIDQHALHERLRYDSLRADLEDHDYAAQQLAVPLLLDVPPSHARLLESNLRLFSKLGIEIEPFGGNTFQVTALCDHYDESRIPEAIHHVLDQLAQGDLFDRDAFLSDFLRLTVEACRGSVKAGDRLSPEERRGLIEGFRRIRPPYTCPHGRPIITELTQLQMEKSFRRKQ